jgi:hypothetical protein
MTRWSPNDAVPPNPASSSSAAYLANMSTLSGSSTAPAFAPAGGYVAASWSPPPSAQATSGPKGSYAATRWSPNDPVPANPAAGSSAAYLATMSTSGSTSYPSTVPPTTYTSLSESAPKKSYAMTTWSPDNSVPPNPASGSSAAYLASMSTTSTAPYSSDGPTSSSPAPPPPVSSGFAATWLPPTSGAKGSYAATKWTPGSPVPVNPASGSSAAYLASMSTVSSSLYGSAPSPSWSSAPLLPNMPATKINRHKVIRLVVPASIGSNRVGETEQASIDSTTDLCVADIGSCFAAGERLFRNTEHWKVYLPLRAFY